MQAAPDRTRGASPRPRGRDVYRRWRRFMKEGSCTEAVRIGGTLQVVRDQVMKSEAPGQPSRRNDTHRAALKAATPGRPDPVGSPRGALAAVMVP